MAPTSATLNGEHVQAPAAAATYATTATGSMCISKMVLGAGSTSSDICAVRWMCKQLQRRVRMSWRVCSPKPPPELASVVLAVFHIRVHGGSVRAEGGGRQTLQLGFFARRAGVPC